MPGGPGPLILNHSNNMILLKVVNLKKNYSEMPRALFKGDGVKRSKFSVNDSNCSTTHTGGIDS